MRLQWNQQDTYQVACMEVAKANVMVLDTRYVFAAHLYLFLDAHFSFLLLYHRAHCRYTSCSLFSADAASRVEFINIQ